ncbi:MAG: ATP-dependent DNA helicase RecG, partial [Dongiaceae bacterium]
QSLPGIGARYAKLLGELGITKVSHLLFYPPRAVIDRRQLFTTRQLKDNELATLIVQVQAHKKPPRRGLPYRIITEDEAGPLDLVFFNPRGDWLGKSFPLESKRVVSGKVQFYKGRPQMAHPDHVVGPERIDEVLGFEPIYGLIEGLNNKGLRQAIRYGLKEIAQLPEWGDISLIRQRHWPEWLEALQRLHHPENAADIAPGSVARQRLAYDELLAQQTALALLRHHQYSVRGQIHPVNQVLRQKLLAALPFRLTASQHRVLAEIDADMQAPKRMLRLLQGDVGSGKTVVAMAAMLNAVGAGKQACIMAPTEILSQQHFRTLSPLAEKLGIRLTLLTGRFKGKAKAEILRQISSGEVDMVIGTHALVQEHVVFKDLGCAVIDEQHRFGVHQRLNLSQKGVEVDTLVMTATPIPRTMVLAIYGDLDVSRLTDKPPGRKPVDTRLVDQKRLDEVVAGLKREIDKGAQVYWVCPLVEESDMLVLTAAEERFKELKKIFGARVGLVHGRLKPKEKDQLMQDFAASKISLLVATSVIEVGVDVPNASIMVVEHAERFGLAQLHQLRGRIGRDAKQSTCILLYKSPLGPIAKQRLQLMKNTEDGFVIAEEDLRLRGSGDVLGTQQSGDIPLRLADLEHHADLLAIAHDDARLLVEKDPYLKTARGQGVRQLLVLFERDRAFHYLQSG